jgi:hypothetical protein
MSAVFGKDLRKPTKFASAEVDMRSCHRAISLAADYHAMTASCCPAA